MSYHDSYSTFGMNFISVVLTVGLTVGLFIVCIVSKWKQYEKAERPGWASLIPFYNLYIEFDIVYGSGIRFLLLFIPLFNIYVFIKFCFDKAKAFDQSVAFGFGLLFLGWIFDCILGFSSNIEYLGTIYEIEEGLQDADEVTEEDLQKLREAAIEKLRQSRARREQQQKVQNNSSNSFEQ